MCYDSSQLNNKGLEREKLPYLYDLKEAFLMNIGIVGAGEWGKNHVRVFSELVGSEHVKVADLDKKRLRYVQEKYEVKTVTSYKDLLYDSRIEGVSICTPSSTHYEICKESLISGKDVLCEKPLAMDSSSCRELIKIAEKEDRILMVGHIFRYDKLTQMLKETIQSGTLGKIFFMQSERLGLRTPRADCGVIFDFAIHDVDLACYLTNCDYPEEVTAIGVSYLSYGVDDFGMVALKFSDDILVHVVVSWLTPRKIRELTIVGKEKSVFADYIAEKMKIYDIGVVPRYNSYSQFKLVKREGRTYEVLVPNVKPLKAEIKHFLDCAKHREKPITDGLVGLRAVEIIEAAYKSLKERRVVKIKNVG